MHHSRHEPFPVMSELLIAFSSLLRYRVITSRKSVSERGVFIEMELCGVASTLQLPTCGGDKGP